MTKSERIIINGLLNRDNKITRNFFFIECKPMFCSIMHNVFRDNADYNEMVNDLYLYLMASDGARLRTFGRGEEADSKEENTYCLIVWLKTTAWRYFVERAQKEQSIGKLQVTVTDDDGEKIEIDKLDETAKDPSIAIDANTYLDMVKLERERTVLAKYFLEGMDFDDISEELGTSKDNLYNIKKRALNKLQKMARHANSNESICSIICEQYVLDTFGIHMSLETLRSFSEENGWLTESGITMKNIGALCQSSGLVVNRTTEACLFDLEIALFENRQVIVAVDGGELTGNQLEEIIEDHFCCPVSDHCVVVLTIDEDTVTLFDPSIGYYPLTVSREHFVDAWEDSNCFFASISPKDSNLSPSFPS